MSTTWNPSDQTGIDLSGGNLIASGHAFNFNGIRSTTSKPLVSPAGKFYFEVACNGSFSDGRSGFGLAMGSASLGNTPGAGAGTLGLNEQGNQISAAGFDTLTVAIGVINSKTIGMALDMPNSLYWFTADGTNWNNGGSANPATGVGGGQWRTNEFPASGGNALFIYATIIDAGATMTLNPSGSFAHAIPSGFLAWDGVPPHPFYNTRIIG